MHGPCNIGIFEIEDIAGFVSEDMASATVPKVMGEFSGFVENPAIMASSEVN